MSCRLSGSGWGDGGRHAVGHGLRFTGWARVIVRSGDGPDRERVATGSRSVVGFVEGKCSFVQPSGGRRDDDFTRRRIEVDERSVHEPQTEAGEAPLETAKLEVPEGAGWEQYRPLVTDGSYRIQTEKARWGRLAGVAREMGRECAHDARRGAAAGYGDTIDIEQTERPRTCPGRHGRAEDDGVVPTLRPGVLDEPGGEGTPKEPVGGGGAGADGNLPVADPESARGRPT